MNPTSQQPAALAIELSRQEAQFAQAFSIIRQAIADAAFPGAALSVAHRATLIASRGFGRFTYEEHAPVVQAHTVFDLASLTKVLATTTLAMLLYDRGQLPLDAPLAQFLPEFVSLAPAHQRARREGVTIRMLLAHCSGLPAYEKLFEYAHTRDELVRAAINTPLTTAPGTRAEYSDIGFILLGEALARKTETSLDEFAQRELFTPLGLSDTWFIPPLQLRPAIPPTEHDLTFRKRVIQGEVNDENAWVMGGVSGHAGVFAAAPDVARFAECLLRGGEGLIKPATIRLFTERQPAPAGTSRALGWDTPSRPSSSGTRFSPTSFGHLGFTGTSLWIDPKRHLSVTLLTNRTWPNRASQAIRDVRPLVHDAVVEAIEGR